MLCVPFVMTYALPYANYKRGNSDWWSSIRWLCGCWNVRKSDEDRAADIKPILQDNTKRRKLMERAVGFPVHARASALGKISVHLQSMLSFP